MAEDPREMFAVLERVAFNFICAALQKGGRPGVRSIIYPKWEFVSCMNQVFILEWQSFIRVWACCNWHLASWTPVI
jgi:hypothetical protein